MSKQGLAAEVDELAGALAAVQSQVLDLVRENQNLAERVSELEAAQERWSVISPGSALPDHLKPAGVPEISPERLDAAQRIGAWLRRCLVGERRGSLGREKVGLASKVYLVCRDFQGTTFDPPRVFDTWAAAKPFCSEANRLGPEAIFIGLPSKLEARLACEAAGLGVPVALRSYQ